MRTAGRPCRCARALRRAQRPPLPHPRRGRLPGPLRRYRPGRRGGAPFRGQHRVDRASQRNLEWPTAPWPRSPPPIAAGTVSTSTSTMIRLQPPPSPRRICAVSKRCAGPAPASSASRTAPGPSRPTISSAPRPMSGCRPGSARSLSRRSRPCRSTVRSVPNAPSLDRELIADAPTATRNAGFGRDVRDAFGQRRQWLIEQELARREQDRIIYRGNMLALLRRRELARVGALPSRIPASGSRASIAAASISRAGSSR